MTDGMISAAQPEAAEVGADVLRAGGNVVDAGIAAALVQTAVDPQMYGIAGMGNMPTLLPGRGVHTTLDFHGRSPRAVCPAMWENRIIREADNGWGFILEGRVNEFGYQAITSLRSLAAFDAALRRFGTHSLAALLPAATEYAAEGCLVRPHVAQWWNQPPNNGRPANIDVVTKLPATRRIYTRPDGALLGVGDTLCNPDMARTLERIGRDGVEDFYRGSIAREIAADMAAHGGLLTLEDLADCGPEENPPLWGSYRGRGIATNHPPGGGVMLVEMLNILENFDLRAIGHNSPEYIRVVSEAMKIATADKDARLAIRVSWTRWWRS
jgi:gamma-glutamyltranspeptidase/glutathione hydrolase